MKIPRNLFGQLAEAILEGGARQATKYLSETEIVRATRRTFKRSRSNSRIKELVVTIGRPNYAERQFIAKCRKAGEPFPVKRLILKWPKSK